MQFKRPSIQSIIAAFTVVIMLCNFMAGRIQGKIIDSVNCAPTRKGRNKFAPVTPPSGRPRGRRKKPLKFGLKCQIISCYAFGRGGVPVWRVGRSVEGRGLHWSFWLMSRDGTMGLAKPEKRCAFCINPSVWPKSARKWAIKFAKLQSGWAENLRGVTLNNSGFLWHLLGFFPQDIFKFWMKWQIYAWVFCFHKNWEFKLSMFGSSGINLYSVCIAEIGIIHSKFQDIFPQRITSHSTDEFPLDWNLQTEPWIRTYARTSVSLLSSICRALCCIFKAERTIKLGSRGHDWVRTKL